MKKSKISKFLVFSLVICLVCSILMLTACNNEKPYENEPNKTGEDKQVVQNGDFTFTTGTSYPRTPSNWTGSIGGTGSYQPEGGLDALKYGVISTGKDYEYNKHNWDNYPNPKTHDGATDNNVLMMYSNKPSSYSYVSSSFDVKPGKFYKLTFWAYTSPTISGEVDSDGTPKAGTDYGAYVKVSGSGINGEWMDVKTNGKWQKFEMYVEGGANSSSSLKVTFGLGYGDKTDKHLTKGHAFFDDVVLEELTDIEGGKTAREQFNEAPNYSTPNAEGVGTYLYKDSFRFSNASFAAYSKYYTSVPRSPLAWSFGYGGVDDDKANDIPSSERAKTVRGIVDLNSEYVKNHYADFGFSKEYYEANLVGKNLFREGLDTAKRDTSALMLYSDKDYSTNYVSSSSITIEKGKIYRLGVWVKTLDTVDGKTTRGSIILSNDNEKHVVTFDNSKYYVDGKEVGTLTKDANGWSEIVLNLRGNNTHDVNYKMTLALGTDGKSQKENWSCGHVFFDDVNFDVKNIDASDKPTSQKTGWEIGVSDKNATSIDLNEFDADGVITNGVTNGNMTEVTNGLPNGFSIKKETTDVTSTVNITTINAKTENVPLPYEVIYKFGDSTTSEVATNVLKFASTSNSAATVKLDQEFTATMNKYYRLAFWVKTENIEKAAGMNFYLNVLNDKGEVSTVNQINEVNSANIGKDNDKYNGWQEVVFYVLGSTTTDTKYTIEMSFGRGNKFSDTLAKGNAYIYNINLQEIDATAYSNASTGSLAKKVELSSSSSSESISNGNFNKLNVSSSTFGTDGKLKKFGSTTNWSVSNDKINDTLLKDKTVKHGTLDLTNVANIFAEEGIDLDISSVLRTLNNDGKNRYALGIYSKDSVVYSYKSNNISLSANSFYSIRVNVFTAGGAKASVKLTSSSPHEEGVDVFSMKESNGDWTEYTFFVKTGLNSATVSLTLSLGDLDKYLSNNDTGKSSGLALFDKITMTTHKSENTYNLDKKGYSNDDGTLKENALEIGFNTDGFTTGSYDKDKLNSINGWSTNSISNAPDINNRDATLSGIIDITRFDEKEIWKYTNKGETDTEKLTAYQQSKVALINKIKDINNGYDEAKFGSSMLMIDNQIASGYSVTNSSGKELKANKYYKISLWLYTFIEENENNAGLTLSLKIGDRNQDVAKIENIKSTNGWKEYTFYVKNVNDIKDTTLSAYLTMQLGTRKTVNDKDVPEYVQGTVFADNFRIDEVTKDVYEKAVSDNKDTEKTIAYVPDKPIEKEKDTTDSNKTKNQVDWKMLSWAIPTIVLAVILIAVLGVFLYKKYAGPKKRTKFKNSKAPKTKKAEVHKKDNFDKFDD